jgi:hypothetical protein
VPVLDAGYITAVQIVESKYHSIFESLMSFLSFVIVSVPAEEVAHAVKFFNNASMMDILEFWILCKYCYDWIQVLT